MPADYEILVTDPVKQGEGVGAFVAYKVRTRSTAPSFTGTPTRPPSEVTRRFRDFSWLQQKLQERNKGIIVPALPEKSAVQKFQMSTEFIEQRRRALQVFLNKVASHPVLRDAKELTTFLAASDEEWTLEMARWQAESSATKTPTGAVSGALQWFKSLQHSAQNMVSGRSDDVLEDAEYIKVRDYITSLEGHLVEAHRQAGRLVRKEAELAGALAEFGNAAEQLGKYDDGPVRAAFDVLCARAGQISVASRQRADVMAATFEAPLKEFSRTIRCVQVAVADRATALGAYVQAKGDLDGKKVKLAKLRGTPGLKDEKIVEAEREVSDADTKVRNAKMAYDTIVSRMTEELNRFQKERAAEMGSLLKEFALTQAQYAADNARAWGALLQDIQQQQAQQPGQAVAAGAAPVGTTLQATS